MFVALRLITLPQAQILQRDAQLAELRLGAAALKGVASSWIAPALDGVAINAGHIVWRMVFATEREAMAIRQDPAWGRAIAPLLAVTEVTSVGYRVTRSAVRLAGPGIWRALIFRVMPEGFPAHAHAIEAGLMMMPKYVSSIRSWALSPVALVEGPKAFTHVWEQEFDDVSGLTGEYMTHPIHWGVVDSWFDAECPNYMVDPQLIQVAVEIDRTIMGSATAPAA